MQTMLLITGDIAAGKSTFSRILSKRCGVPAFQKDSIKEVLGDFIGFRNREENLRLSHTTMGLMRHIFLQFAATGGNLILEANFHEDELEQMHRLAKENGYQVLTILLRGSTDVLYQRYMNRIKNENRHPVHLSTTMDVKADFKRITQQVRTEKVIGDIIEIDATDFSYQSDSQLLERIDAFLLSRYRDYQPEETDRKEESGMDRRVSVAIDGPSGAGKSTLARAAAQRLNLIYIDTGAIYRTVALYALRTGTNPKDAAAMEALLAEIRITMDYDENGLQRMNLNGEDVSGLIRTQEVSMATSDVSAHPSVRAFLLDMQRNIAKTRSVIMDGRDIGTVILPDADVKIFLTASSETRARRRWLELKERGTPKDFGQLLRETRERDDQDANRATAPLRPASDAVILDTTELNFDQSLDRIIEIIRERAGS